MHTAICIVCGKHNKTKCQSLTDWHFLCKNTIVQRINKTSWFHNVFDEEKEKSMYV